MSDRHDSGHDRAGEASIVAQLRSYGDSVEQMVPPTPTARPDIRPGARRRAPLVSLAVAAAVALVVAGAVLVADTSDDGDLVISPAAGGGPATTMPTETEPESPTSVPTSVPTDSVPRSGSGLQPVADAAHLVTFDSVGPYTVGQAAPSEGIGVYYDSERQCGSWTPLTEPDGSGSPPMDAEVIFGISGPVADLRANVLYVRSPAYRTASGVGVGTDLAALQRVYGDGLVVDRADGWENPTGGLLASYSDVAAVAQGDRAITFTLTEDVVTEMKISEARWWGDDEGCA
ncbi:MAG: hypothetical protein M9922_12550 [Microthrixaceae bacterium]|nr:hypothetical protein [Microthrixaceae bacterium]MCO5322215.1 hypothetical protein [Microthrixaceae bacterium]